MIRIIPFILSYNFSVVSLNSAIYVKRLSSFRNMGWKFPIIIKYVPIFKALEEYDYKTNVAFIKH